MAMFTEIIVKSALALDVMSRTSKALECGVGTRRNSRKQTLRTIELSGELGLGAKTYFAGGTDTSPSTKPQSPAQQQPLRIIESSA